MIWDKKISLEEFIKSSSEWYKDTFIGDPPVDAQYALDLIFKTLIDDKEHYSYLTTISESTEQINFIMLDLILYKYSRKYRKLLKKKKKENNRS